MKTNIIFIFIISLIYLSCSPEYRARREQIKCNNHLVKAIRGGCLDTTSRTITTKDTTAPEINTNDSVKLSIDTAALFRLWKNDSCFSQQRIDTILKYINFKSIHEKTDNYSLDVWFENGQLKKKLWIKPCIETNTKTIKAPVVIKPVEPKHKQIKLWPYIIIIIIQSIAFLVLLIFIIILIFKLRKV